jgi:paraquat-inducible protein B
MEAIQRTAMGKRISPAMIGAFVVGSFALLVAAIIVVGSGSLFKKPRRFVCMFAGDVNGLKVGAPVKFRGVPIGSVEVIELALKPSEGVLRPDVKELRLPVIIGIDNSMIIQQGGTGHALTETGFEDMIARGLRAQLSTESILTGLLYIDLDLHPNSKLSLGLVPGSGDLCEIPTVPTKIEAIQEQATEAIAKLDQIDLKQLVASLTDAANSINQLTSSSSLKATLDGLEQNTANLDRTLTSVRAAVDNVNGKIDPLVTSLRASSVEANATMKDTREALLEIRSAFDPDSPLYVRMSDALDQLSDTTQALGSLADYLQRNPSALIRGKYVPEKDQ